MTRRSLIGTSSLALAATGNVSLPDRANFRVAEFETCLNAARWHPLSNGARAAANQYQEYKQRGMWNPEMPHPQGGSQPKAKALFAELINASADEIALVQSTTAAENLVVRAVGLPGKGGNVVTDGLHFEGSLYLYDALRAQGLEVRMVPPRNWRIDANEFERAIDKNTRLVAVSAVSYINGFTHDLARISEVAHSRGALVYADLVQAAGAMPVDIRASGVDFAASASYKWLMGDFGLGFLYVKNSVLPKLVRPVHSFRQLSDFTYHQFPGDVPAKSPIEWKQFDSAAGYFEIGTVANIVSQTLTYSLEYIQRLGVDRIRQHSARLIERLRREVPYPAITPDDARGPIVAFELKDPAAVAEKLKKAKVDVSISSHRMRVSPSVYNDDRDIDRLVAALKST